MSRRFSIAFIPAGSVSEVAELVATAESLGFDRAWIPDQGFHRDPFVILEAVAARTSTIEIGVGITSPFTRHPVQIARAAATLAEASHGRFLLGLGTANVANVVQPLGIRYEKPAARIRDAIEIIRGLLAGQRLTFSGVADELDGVRLDFAIDVPVPIYLGTRSPRLLELAGELAEGVLAESLFTDDAWAYVEERVGRGLQTSGRQRTEFDGVAWQLISVTDTPESKIAEYRPWIVRSIEVGPPEVIARIGVDPSTQARVSEAIAEHGADSKAALSAVTDEAVKTFMIIGRPEEVIDQLTLTFERGVNTINVLDTGPLPSVLEHLRSFAELVLPAFK